MSAALIVGAGEAPYRRRPDERVTTHGLLAEAARAALASAGLEPSDIDGLGVSSFSLAPDRGIDLAVRLGLRLGWLMDAGTGGASALDLLQHAQRAVEAGDARAVLLVAGDRLDPPAFTELVDGYNHWTRDLLTPLPTGGPNALFALVTRRHMAAHGLGRETYGAVAIAQRTWAAGNENAAYRDPLTPEAYLAAPVVADPLTIYDCVPVVSGANAIVVAADGVAAGTAVRTRALRMCHNADSQEGSGLATGLAEAREGLWAEAGLGPGDADVVSVYDDYPVMALVQLDELGFAGGDLPGLRRRPDRDADAARQHLGRPALRRAGGRRGRTARARRGRDATARGGGRETGARREDRRRCGLRDGGLPLRRQRGRRRPGARVSGAAVSVCATCGWQGFPRRLWCPSCGAEALGERDVGAGLVEDETVLHHAAGRELAGAVSLGTVLLDGGGRAIARLDGAVAGDRVAVDVEEGALVARRESRA